MNQSFYIGALGAQQQQRRMTVQGNNIANVNSYGYKTEKARFSSLLYEDVRAIDNAEVRSGLGARILMTSTDHAQGGLVDTGRPLDYMINGHGFFALVDLETEEISFTRNGAFMKAGRMEPTEETDENGEPVMEMHYYLSDGDGRFVLDRDGELIRITDEYAELPVGVFSYENYNGMARIASTRFRSVEKNGMLYRVSEPPIRGVLEGSNVDLAEELTKVIESQRIYSIALKMVQTSDEIETTINNLRG